MFICHQLQSDLHAAIAALILQVESLFPVEMGPNMMPVEAFLENGLPLLDKGIQERVEKASSNGNVLRYVCLIEESRYCCGSYFDISYNTFCDLGMST